jgi:hypothetical protein
MVEGAAVSLHASLESGAAALSSTLSPKLPTGE